MLLGRPHHLGVGCLEAREQVALLACQEGGSLAHSPRLQQALGSPRLQGEEVASVSRLILEIYPCNIDYYYVDDNY